MEQKNKCHTLKIGLYAIVLTTCVCIKGYGIVNLLYYVINSQNSIKVHIAKSITLEDKRGKSTKIVLFIFFFRFFYLS